MKNTKASLLWRELNNCKMPVSSAEVTKIGLTLYYTRSPRQVRLWTEQGYLRALNKDEKIALNLSTKIAWYDFTRRSA
jgi:hypothetical protein